MRFTNLPMDVLNGIIFLGGLEIQDIINLSRTCKCLSQSLLNEQTWKRIYTDNWGSILADYEIATAISSNANGESWFHLSLRLYKKQMELAQAVEEYAPESPNHIGVFLDRYGTDVDYVPILQNVLNQLEKTAVARFSSASDVDCNISKMALVLNLIRAQNVRIAIEYLSSLSVTTSPDASRIEFVCFRLGLLFKSFHDLVKNRARKLERIRNTLHSRIYMDELACHKARNVVLNQGPDEEALLFKDDDSFKLFVRRVLNLAHSTFSIKPLVQATSRPNEIAKYSPYEYYEDFDIMRIYADLAKGDSLLVRTILAKALGEFLSRFSIIIGGKRIKSCEVKLTKSFIKVCDVLYLLRPTCLTDTSYSIEMISVKDFLVALSRMHREGEKRNYLEAINEKYVIDHFKDILEFNSLSRFYESEIDRCLLPSLSFISPDEFAFFRVVCHLVSSQHKQDDFGSNYIYDGKDLKRDLLKSNNFIHLNSIYQNFSKFQASMRQQFKIDGKMSSNDKHLDIPHGQFFTKRMNLFDPQAAISFQKLRDSICPGLMTHRMIGLLVSHTRFGSPAIVLGSKPEETEREYLVCITSSGQFGVYHRTSVIPRQVMSTGEVLVKSILHTFPIDILGLYFFQSVGIVNQYVSFN
ncbi:uncharacterized protein RJT20DRAFT_130242 [Scheffersomyces xylosifermentans]|uniref:uncharacterized protein n=1 Tax=Scheffersomyces xylosifermentans TaxID=1304137 RepID=UPI00315DBE74